MVAYEVKSERWAYKLAPQLVGKAQQACAGKAISDAGDYEKVKAAILKQYNITEESYCLHFRSAKLKLGESNREMLVRLRSS